MVQEKIRHLPDISRATEDAAVGALEDAEQGAPLLRDYSPEPEEDDQLPHIAPANSRPAHAARGAQASREEPLLKV